MRALITGGAGFVGSHLADTLLAGGHQVFVLDDLSTGAIENIEHLQGRPDFHYTIDSVTNEPLLAELVDRADVVFHLAAAVGVKKIVEEPVNTIECNVHGTEIVLKHANKKKRPVRHRLDLRGLRQERRRAVPRGRRPGARREHAPPLGVRVQQAHRRVPRARLLEGTQAAGDHRPAVQHRGTAADRALRHGDPDVRAAGARRAQPITVFGDGTQSRSFTYVGDVVGALARLAATPAAVGAGVQHRQRRGDHHPRAWPRR